MLIIDSREPRSLKERLCGLIEDCATRQEPVGDYLIFDKDGHVLGVERKAIDDLLSSLAGGKLRRQVSALKKYDRQLLLLQGHWRLSPSGKVLVGTRESGWVASTVQMILLGVQRAFGAQMLWVSSEDELVNTIVALVKQGQKRCFLETSGEAVS